MANDATVSQDLADKFKTEKDSPYLRFVRGEGLDIISAQYVPNLRTVELKPWPRKGGKGCSSTTKPHAPRTTVMSARSRRERRSSRNTTCSRT
jgi:hypothetical protein